MEAMRAASTTHSQRGFSSPTPLHDDEIGVYLRTTKTVPFKIKKSDTVENLKALIQEKEGISKTIQDLLFDGKQLMDGQRLADCGIQRNSILQLSVQNSTAVQIFVKFPSNQKTIILEAAKSDTVRNIKSMIQENEGIQSDTFVLVYGGNLLEDDRTLASFNMRNASTILLVFNPKDVLSISVKVLGGRILKLSVKFMFTVSAVKEIVEGIIGASWANNRFLYYAGKQLDNSKTLAFYEIKEGSVLQFLPPMIQIFIKTWVGKTLSLHLRQSNTVEDIKTQVFEKLKIPAGLQSIVYGGKRLEEDRTLESYNIENLSTLHMVLAPSTFYMRLSNIGNYFGNYSSTFTVGSLKDMIKCSKLPNTRVKDLYFNGVLLQDDHTLAHYNMKSDSQIAVVFSTN